MSDRRRGEERRGEERDEERDVGRVEEIMASR